MVWLLVMVEYFGREVVNVTYEEIINKALSSDNEDLWFELKESKKYSNVSDIKKNLLKLIVAFANREGGYLVIGIKDNGQPEGLNIFENYKEGTKSGIDKFKELIGNTCKDLISPIINIDIQYYRNEADGYEFVAIKIPMRSNMPHAVIKRSEVNVESRKYYIKTSHGCNMVTDTQLEWLFNGNNREVEESQYAIEITTYKDLSGIPLSIGKIGDRYVIQPQVIHKIDEYIISLQKKSLEECTRDIEYRRELLSEILMYAIIQSLDGNYRVYDKYAEFMPLPNADFLLNEAAKGNEKTLFTRADKKINFPPNSRIAIEKGKKSVIFTIINEYVEIALELFPSSWEVGLPNSNPYKAIFLENHGIEGQNLLHDRYEVFEYVLNIKTTRLFPDVIDSKYYASYEFASKLKNNIKMFWDINYYMKEYPHYRNLYSIEYKLDSLINEVKGNEKKQGWK